MQGVQGGELINGDPNYGETKSYNTNYNSNRWISPQNPGDGRTPYEDTGFNWMLTDYVVEDASYFALREVNLGYNFPANLVKKIGLSSLRLYTSGQNLDISDLTAFKDGYAITKYKNVTRTGATGSSLTFPDVDFPLPFQVTVNEVSESEVNFKSDISGGGRYFVRTVSILPSEIIFLLTEQILNV